MTVGFKFSRMIVLESLPSGEPRTGQHLVDYISALEVDDAPPVSIAPFETRDEFFALLHLLRDRSTKGEIPLIHLECHGSTDGSGFVAADGSQIQWEEVSPVLTAINMATKFNLLVFVAACNGGYFLKTLSGVEEAPCFGLIAPTDELDPGEVMRGTRAFYRKVLSTLDIGLALGDLRRDRLQEGEWFCELAENWFLKLVVNYVKTHGTTAALEERARRMRREAKKQGQNRSIGHFKRGLLRAHRTDLVGKYFDRFFHVEAIPENAIRFARVREELDARIRALLQQREFRL